MHFPSYDWRHSFYNRRLEINGFISSRTSKKVDEKKNTFNASVIIFFLYLKINILMPKNSTRWLMIRYFSNQIRSMKGNGTKLGE